MNQKYLVSISVGESGPFWREPEPVKKCRIFKTGKYISLVPTYLTNSLKPKKARSYRVFKNDKKNSDNGLIFLNLVHNQFKRYKMYIY